MSGWAILVIWDTGGEAYVRLGADASGPIYRYRSRIDANAQAAFMKIGMDDVQSVNVVPFPGSTR